MMSSKDQRPSGDEPAGSWRDLREWLDVVAARNGVMTISQEVDPNEELSAITFMGSRDPISPVFIFDNLKGNGTDARVLTNLLGASRERYALTLGLDPDLPVMELIRATRT